MITAVVNAKDVRARLLSMAEKARYRAYNVAMRRGAAPVVRELQRGWGNSKRNSGLVVGEIGDGQQAQVNITRRGTRAGTATLKIGANYRLGGLVKLWHILEHGFTHYGRSGAYRNMGADANRLKRQRQQFFRGVRKAWNDRMPEADRIVGQAERARAARRSEASASSRRRIPGFKISTKIVERVAPDLAAKVQQFLVAEVMKPLKGAR